MTTFFNKPDWPEIATRSMDQVKEMIQTGATKSGFMPAREDILTRCDPPRSTRHVLDFGCGVGRNLEWMARHTDWRICGYDHPAMLARAREFMGTAGAVALEGDWSVLRTRKFDTVLAILVLQHVPPDELLSYLADLRSMTHCLLVHGRRFNDHGPRSTWEIVESNGWTPARHLSDDPSTTHGPEDHHTVVYRPTASA